MKRQSCIKYMMVAGLVFGAGVGDIRAESDNASAIEMTQKYINLASSAIEEARIAIENGKRLVTQIPEDSELSKEVNQMLLDVAENWEMAVNALEGAKKTVSKLGTIPNGDLASDYAMLASINAGVALSGAKVVQTGIIFIDAVAKNKMESIEIIRGAMKDSLNAASQVQDNYEQVKRLLVKKHSK